MADLVTLLEGRNAIAEGPTRGPSAIKRGAPLFEAVQNQDTAAVRALLAQDRTLANARNGQGETPLIADIFWGNVEIAHALVDAGTDVNAISDWGDTALKKAQFFHKDEIAALLQAHGAK
jgi:ankyrin repeat protein